ncbi:putative XRE family transcriptional regulator [Thiocapsa sp. KS1]|nr:RodZ domain-containing protein [Thiocapsa sp. KS1]CRI64113.1 putative XRE family transcriptional regulator [Thiocapsa sp. KS1]
MTNQTQATDPNDQNVVEFGDSPGRRLRVQRQSRGLAVERIAAQLHLKPEIVEALEQDRFDLLPDPVFITGYLRNYARMLGLDPLPLIAAYQAHAGTPKSIEPTRPIPGADLDSGGTRFLVRLVSLALAAAVIAVIALWWHDRPEVSPELSPAATELGPDATALALDARSIDGSASAVAEETPDTATGPVDRSDRDRVAIPESRESPIPDAAEPGSEPGSEQARAAVASPTSETGSHTASSAVETAPPGPSETPSARTTTPAPSPGATPAPAQIPTDPVVAAAVPAPTPEQAQAQAAEKGIVLEFTGPSWLEVRDAAGQRIIAGEMKAGDRREVTGQAPLRFTVGRVNNSSMTVDGKPFDLEGRSRGNVARFSLDPESPE